MAAGLPPAFRLLQGDLEKQLRHLSEDALGRLGWVTREEFEVQSAVLARTRAKIATLEAELLTLEQTYLHASTVAD